MEHALTEAARALAKARIQSQTPARRSEAGRIGATARWNNKEKHMVTVFRTRLTTADEQRQGSGSFFRRKVVYAVSPDVVRTLLREAVASGHPSVTSNDLVEHSMGRLREPALLAVMDGEAPIVKMDPDPQGDKLSREHSTEIGEEINVVRKSIGLQPGFGMITREKPIVYRVPSRAALRTALLKAVRAGEIEAGAMAALDAGRLPEGTLLKAFPTAQRTDGHMDLMKAAAELDTLVARNSMSDGELFERRMR